MNIIQGKIQDGKFISTPGHYKYASGEKHSFGFDVNTIHFFNTATGERIN